MKYKILCFFFLSMILGCSNNNIENHLSYYHNKISITPELSNEIELILKKEVDPKFFGVLYKIKNDDNLYYGFINENNEIMKVFKLNSNKKESLSNFNNRNCLVNKKEKGNNVILNDELTCYSIFVGEVPIDRFSRIELEWNCSDKDIENQELINGKYFFFLKKGNYNNICNISLFDKKGRKTNISYNPETGKWMKLKT